MDPGLTGRVTIVAPASKGLGRAVAEELAREGAHVAICARTAGTLEETAAHLQRTIGREVFHQSLDIADSTAGTGFVAVGETRFHRDDVCVTNSSGPPSNPLVSTQPGDWCAPAEGGLRSLL
jgi:3-oxoacyl-[acyl-carrier protein] reductase